MAIKKKTTAKTKGNQKKKIKSSVKKVKKTSDKMTEILLTASEIDSEINDDVLDDSGEIVITEDNYILVTDYNCSMSAYQDPEEDKWYYALEVFTDSGKLIDIHSQQTYKTYQDALFDCYGIIEYLGFGITDPENCATISVNHWNDAEEKYDEEIILFNGSDFFKSKKI